MRTFGSILLVVAIAVLSGCGGDDDDGGITASLPNGVCAACDDSAQCDAGLSCTSCEGTCTAATKRCAGSSSDSPGTLSCENGQFPAGCSSVEAQLVITETAKGENCTFGEQPEPLDRTSRATLDFVQNECDVSYTVPPSTGGPAGGLPRVLKIVGDRVHMNGLYLAPSVESFKFERNEATAEGVVTGSLGDRSLRMELNGEGAGNGSVEGGKSFACSGTLKIVAVMPTLTRVPTQTPIPTSTPPASS